MPALLLLASCGGNNSSSPPQPGGSGGGGTCDFQGGGNCSVIVNGVTRTYVVHLPQNLQPGVSGLVIAFHGARGSGSQFERYTRLDQKADQAGFAAVYPDGLPNRKPPSTGPSGATSWNGYFNPAFGTNPSDDSGFVRELILTLEASLHPDAKKIFVTGMSAGGYMAHRSAIDHADLISAAGIVEGRVEVQTAGGTRTPPSANSSVSVLILHGDADQVIRYCGLTNTNVTVASQDQTFDYWSQTPANSCSALNTSGSLCTGFGGTPTSIKMKDATACQGGAEVKLYLVAGAIHTWYQVPLDVPPGTRTQPYNPNLNSTTGLVTNDILWNFFISHANRERNNQIHSPENNLP